MRFWRRWLLAVTVALCAVAVHDGSYRALAEAIGPPSRFVPVGPFRLADTRDPDCRCSIVGLRTIRVTIGGRDDIPVDIPTDIVAAAVTITATNAGANGYVTAYTAGQPRPETSTLNLRAGRAASNSAIIPVGTGAAIDVYAQVDADVIVDVTGVFIAAESSSPGRFRPTTPARLLDTRDTSTGRLTFGQSVTVPLPAGVSSDALAVAVNVTTTDEGAPGFVVGYPAGSAPAPTSFTNPDGSGRPHAASAILPVSAGGLTLMSSSGGHLIVDLVGWFTGSSAPVSTDGLFVPLDLERVLDTRVGASRLWPGATHELASVAPGAGALVTNITLARPDAAGFVTAYPAGTALPPTSSINAVARDEVVANLAISSVSTRGTAYFSNAGTDLVVDVAGYFTGTPVPAVFAVPPPVVPNPRVLLIGDSTFAALNVVPASQTALRGFQPILDLEPCRRLVRPSCQSAYTLRVPPTAVETINAAPPTIDIVVIRAGYNDGSVGFDAAVGSIVSAARAKGVRWVLWLTYSDGTGNQVNTYNHNNAVLRQLAGSPAYPELVLADWRTYAAGSSGWYANDRVHLIRNGAWATADYLSRWIAHIVRRSCPVPWAPGQPTADPCPSPDETAAATATLPNLAALYSL